MCQATGKAGSVVFSDIPTNTVLGEFLLDGVLRVVRVGNFPHCNMTYGALVSRCAKLDGKSMIVHPHMWADKSTPPNDHNLVLDASYQENRETRLKRMVVKWRRELLGSKTREGTS